MGSRDRDTKSFQDKLKVFFKKGPSAPLLQNELVITPELQKELGCDTPLGRRLRVIREVAEKVLHVRVHEGGVDKIWANTKDLLEDGNAEARHAVLALLRSIADGQQDLLIMRTILFRYLHDTPPARLPDDYPLRFKLLYSLTNSGKDIKCLEDQIGSFLLEWFPEIQAGTHMVDFVRLVTNVVKFNAVYLDEEIVHGIVNHACHQCVYSGEAAVVLASLALLEAVVSYSLLPLGALPAFVAALCRTVNVEHYCQPSWKLMRLVLAADLGHAALRRLVHALRAPPAADADAGLARGAVFHVNMALWGPNRVPSLHASHLAVLPAFRRALDLRRPVVTYEVVMALQSLVARAPLELHEPAWDTLLDIADAALEQARAGAGWELTAARAHALLSHVEQLQEAGQYLGDGARLLALLDAHAAGRPEASAARVVGERAAALRGPDVAGALALVDRYVRRETRLPVRLHALAALLDFIKRNRIGHGSELAERVGGALAAACATAPEAALRAAAARALPQLARLATTDACIDLIDHLERILNRPFEVSEGGAGAGSGEGDGAELRAAAAGLVDLFQYKVLRAPAAHAARVFVVLLDHLDLHYRRPAVFSRYPDIRLQILDMIFGLRANASNCVGFVYDAAGAAVLGAGGGGGGGAAGRAPLCSALLLAEPPAPRAARPAAAREPPPGACVLPVGRAARTLVAALTREADWAVLAHVLRALPPLLTARALAPGRRAMDLDLLAATLCSMVADRSMCVPERLAGVRLPVSQFHAAVLPALAALAGHHAYLEPQTQQRVVRCLLKYGMVLRTPQPYIVALTLFTLEARDTMVKLLPEVLLDLSKISDTTAIAGPMLEFLSTLTRLPRAFASFVEDQYMSVFAIVLPYTNHARYNHYVVSLAHHVIAAWFLKCRLSYRRNFVKFIIHGLHNYIIMPFEEQLQVRARPPPPVNEDSSNRQRSSSLGSRAVSRPLGARGAGRGEGGAAGGAGAGGAPAAFHVELTETCVDLLARYTFTPCSAKPQRSDTAEFLFSGGQSTTWLVGHKLVTVTTSGCLQNSMKQGLCERCATLCRQHAESVASPLPSATPPAAPAPPAAAPPQLHVDGPDAEPAPEIKRQNSSENKSQDPIIDAINQFSQRFEMLSREVDCDETGWSRVGALAGGGACPCWCARWAELHVRSPTGDVSWLLRLQNHISSAQLQEWPLQDVLALLSPPPLSPAPTPAPPAPAPAAPPAAAPVPPRDLHKSSSDSVVEGARAGGAGAGPPRTGTRPINIPGSPQRQSSSSTTDDDDLLLMVPEGKSRHPVRRSNSSPEMSSWKARAMSPPPAPEPDAAPPPHVKKPGKKGGVSCEAIPEEMCGTSPQPPAPAPAASSPHAPLMTYNSDPGTAPPETDDGDASGAADTSHLHLQKTSSDSRVASGGGGADELPPLARSKRSNTISVMSPTRRTRESLRGAGPGAAGGGGGAGGGLAPSFVFLQLYHNMSTAPCAPHVAGAARGAEHERPLKISGVQHERTIKNLDLVPPVETYKVGVLYVGPGQQDDEVCILRNEHGSVRYCDFLRRLGSLVPLDADEPNLFLNLERGGEDGTYTYVWTDDVMQVQFHVATAMPTLARDPSCNEKRKYIGNDYVSIVYNDSGHDFSIHTIKGQFNSCIVVVEPLAGGTNRVRVCTKDERIRTEFLPHLEPNTVSDSNVALLARQQALHCSLAAMISQSLVVGGEPYASNWLARLRLLKRLRARATADRRAAARPAPYHPAPPPAHPAYHIDDFNDYA
ncbi:tuberin isoform X2 [Aricia agestis]|uniref:tuberin isoform X2 n=1 Tax=Aricia agestis TaxID=91739 RepID=UPI001C20A9F7|nr:tuberin isoform X2 [Aricia agestis]